MTTVINCDVKKEVLPNGIVFIHNHNKEQPVVATIVFLKMGDIYEPVKFSGISELLQATILKGTKNRTAQQIAEEIESLGGSISADSDTDFSTLSVAVGSQFFEKSIEILSDIFCNPTFPKDEVEKEKNNIIAGILSRKDRIFDVAIDELLSNLYGEKHPYGRRPEKSIKTIKKIDQKKLLFWWERFYGIDRDQNNLVIVTSGDVDFDTAKSVILKYFSNIKTTVLPEVEVMQLKVKSNRYVKKKVHFKQGYLMYGYLSFPLRKQYIKEYLALKLLNAYLGGGMSSKLFEILREEHSLCYETNCFYPSKFLDSHFVIYLGLDYERIEVAKREISFIADKVINGEMLNNDELNEVKRKLKGRFVLDHQTNLRQAWYLGFWEIMGMGYDYDFKYVDEIEKITLTEVREVAKRIFSSPNVVVELIPHSK